MPAFNSTVTTADKISEWAKTRLLNATVLSRNTDAYNHVKAAVDELLAQDWTSQPVAAPKSNDQRA